MITMKEYIVKRGGVELTMLLSEETAKRTKARPVSAKVEAPEADSADDEAKAAAEAEAKAKADGKAAAPANKGRTPQDK